MTMKLGTTLFILLIGTLFANAQKCGSCPKNCEYGTTQVTENGKCICVCALTPCAVIRCTANTTCEVRIVEGKPTGRCLPIGKPNSCPTRNYLSGQKLSSKTCNEDKDCKGIQKCCPAKKNNICTKPCFETKCKCVANSLPITRINSKGCEVCGCQAPPVCGPVCEIYCMYGNVIDSKGCPTCKCKTQPDLVS